MLGTLNVLSLQKASPPRTHHPECAETILDSKNVVIINPQPVQKLVMPLLDKFDLLNENAEIKVASWNIAAPNNNPFEFWNVNESKEYCELMSSIENCFDDPAKVDMDLGCVFSQRMYDDLRAQLACHLDDEELAVLDRMWTAEFKSKRLVSQFLKDESLGEKRLISMPERITSSVEGVDGVEHFRPSPITGFEDEMGDIPTWWPLWLEYMFSRPVLLRGERLPCAFSLLEPIPRAKYPDLTAEEAAASRPLQALYLALFDAALTWLLSAVAPSIWQPLRRALHRALHADKPAACVAVLRSRHAAADVIFVQEASEAFATRAAADLDHHVLRPPGADGRRRQMSLVLLRRGAFHLRGARDVTADVRRRGGRSQ